MCICIYIYSITVLCMCISKSYILRVKYTVQQYYQLYIYIQYSSTMYKYMRWKTGWWDGACESVAVWSQSGVYSGDTDYRLPSLLSVQLSDTPSSHWHTHATPPARFSCKM